MPAHPYFPDSVWEGQSASRPQGLAREAGPDQFDWEQVVAEIAALEHTVLVNGGGESAARMQGTNKDSVTLNPGSAVTNHVSGVGFVRASATDNQNNAVGLIVNAVAPDGAAVVQVDGVFHLDDWSAVIGTTTLAPKVVYYLDSVPGQLTTLPPLSGIVQAMGRAVSDTDLELSPEMSILL